MGFLHIDDFYPHCFLWNLDSKAGIGNRPGKLPIGNYCDVLRQAQRGAVVDHDLARQGFSRALDLNLPIDVALGEGQVIAGNACCITHADITAEENLLANLLARIAQRQIGKRNR